MEKKKFQKLFPHLYEEMEKGVSEANFILEGEDFHTTKSDERKWAGHNPNVIDFIRRCDTEKQAEEIIDYLENKGEITSVRANQLRDQLLKKGIRSFGKIKEKDYYHKNIR